MCGGGAVLFDRPRIAARTKGDERSDRYDDDGIDRHDNTADRFVYDIRRDGRYHDCAHRVDNAHDGDDNDRTVNDRPDDDQHDNDRQDHKGDGGNRRSHNKSNSTVDRKDDDTDCETDVRTYYETYNSSYDKTHYYTDHQTDNEYGTV